MKYLKISNDGELDIRLVALMGGTTKAKKEHLIGNFGSGLKYTLAFLLRNNLDFKIYSGENLIDIKTDNEVIRDESFDIICINGHRTSITCNMGLDWQAWMIIRELWSNALDEGGQERSVTETVVGAAGKTTFYIQVDAQIKEVLDNWNKYFIQDQEPISVTPYHKIYPGGKFLRLYKQGVLIYEDTERPAMYSYDITHATLNELREFKGSSDFEVTHALAGANSTVVKYFLENITDAYHEALPMAYEYSWIDWGSAWREEIGNAKLMHPEILKEHHARGIALNPNDFIIVPKPVFKALTQKFEGISALRIAKDGSAFYENYDEKIENMVKQGLVILESCGYTMHPELEYRYGFFEDKRTLAQIQFDEKIICVSQTMLGKSLFSVVAMLIEENEHFNTGMRDESREFQQHFIDLYTKSLLALNEIQI